MFETWKEAFIWLLGIVGTYALYLLRSIKSDFDQMHEDIGMLMQERAVNREVERRKVERRQGDEGMADAIKFYGINRRQGERRAGP